MTEIRESQKLTDEAADSLTEVIKSFKKGFAATGGASVVPNEHVAALDEEKLDKESVKVHQAIPAKTSEKSKNSTPR